MKKISFYTLITLVMITNAFSQNKSKDIDIIFGEEAREARSSMLESILGYDETGIYILKTEARSVFSLEKDYFIEHFDNKMNQTKWKEIIIKDKKGDERDYEFIVYMNNTLYLFSSIENKKTDNVILYAQTINKKTLRLNNDSRKITEINYAKKGSKSFGDFEYEISRDESKLMIHYLLPVRKKEKEKIALIVLDKDLELLWGRKCTLSYMKELFEDERYRVDNDGNAYVLGIVYKDKALTKRRGKPNYKYQLICYKDEGETYEEYPIALSGKFITDMQIAITEKNDIICAGFYSNVGTFSISGSYYLNVDGSTGDIITKSYKKFGLEFITQNMTERKANRAKKKKRKGKDVELFEYDLDNIILRDDGGAVLVGEQFFIEAHSYTSQNGVTSTRYYYNYNDIIVINIDPEGQIEWAKKIPKEQRSVSDFGAYSSYAISILGDKMFFIFNDNPKNLMNKGDGKLKRYNPKRESIVTLVRMDNEGNYKKEALYKMKRSSVLIRPKLSEQISDDEMIIFGKKGKNQQFTKLIYK